MKALPRNASLPPATIAKVASLIFKGFDDEEISVYTNLPVSRVKALKAGKDDLRVRKQTLILKEAALERIIKGKGKLSGLEWFLERRWPKQYAKAEIQLTMGTTLTHNQLVISAEQAKDLLQRSKPVLDDIDKLIEAKQVTAAED